MYQLVEKFCPVCGNKFYDLSFGTQKYCSDSCKQKNQRWKKKLADLKEKISQMKSNSGGEVNVG